MGVALVGSADVGVAGIVAAAHAVVTEDGARVRDPAGEYVPVVFLSDGDLGVVTPIQNGADGRGGFSWWRIERR